MSRRLRSIVPATLIIASFFDSGADAYGWQTPSPEQAVVDALRANPLILPYSVRVTTGKSGEIILSGKVGTSGVHDLVIRTVIDLGLVPHDDLVIDTAEAHRVAIEQVYSAGATAFAPIGPAPSFVYPEPLFGRLDEPFWGMEPPAVSFPPGAAMRPGGVVGRPAATTGDPQGGRASAPAKGRLQLAVDEFGQVFLSGDVATEADKQLIEQEAARVPGVTRVSSELRVVDRKTPPPIPKPADRRPVEMQPAHRVIPPPPAPADAVVPPPAIESASGRALRAVERRPALKALGIEVKVQGDVATLSGKVPSVYEDMLAFRAVEQTPGVHQIEDRLEFPLPDENTPNPLRDRARPEDLEPYLLHHIRRHVGDSAHVDRVVVQGDLVQVRGSLSPGEEPARMEAVLRSIPLLRDFRIESAFTPD